MLFNMTFGRYQSFFLQSFFCLYLVWVLIWDFFNIFFSNTSKQINCLKLPNNWRYSLRKQKATHVSISTRYYLHACFNNVGNKVRALCLIHIFLHIPTITDPSCSIYEVHSFAEVFLYNKDIILLIYGTNYCQSKTVTKAFNIRATI